MKEIFINTYSQYIHREGAQWLLKYLTEYTDFFTAPASTKYHLAKEGGLCEHSLNVFRRLSLLYKAYAEEAGIEITDKELETIAVVSLLHDVCKTNFYTVEMRNKKNEQGKWEQVPYYTVDDKMPYGHGEKSVYIISGFMKLSREEAFAIRYHMGSWNAEEARNAGKAFEMYPLAFLVHVADEYATFIDEKEI